MASWNASDNGSSYHPDHSSVDREIWEEVRLDLHRRENRKHQINKTMLLVCASLPFIVALICLIALALR